MQSDRQNPSFQITVTNPLEQKFSKPLKDDKMKQQSEQRQTRNQTINAKNSQNDDFPIPSKLPPRKKVQCRPYFQFLKISQSLPAPKQMRRIKLSQLKEHNSVQSAWISIDNNVYDVTTYLAYHPGGEIILSGCGRDGTSLFNKFHAFVNHSFMLQKYKIGFLVGENKPFLSF